MDDDVNGFANIVQGANESPVVHEPLICDQTRDLLIYPLDKRVQTHTKEKTSYRVPLLRSDAAEELMAPEVEVGWISIREFCP